MNDTHMDDFEKTLLNMSKPEIPPLRHEEILSKALFMNRHRHAVSWWWLGIPLYIIGALIMKSMYSPGEGLLDGIRQLRDHNKILAYGAFVVVPLLLMAISAASIFELSKIIKTRDIFFLKTILVSLIVLVLSIIVLLLFLNV